MFDHGEEEESEDDVCEDCKNDNDSQVEMEFDKTQTPQRGPKLKKSQMESPGSLNDDSMGPPSINASNDRVKNNSDEIEEEEKFEENPI